jgi:hypothetical protein
MPDKPVTWTSFFETFPLYKKWKMPAEVPRDWPIPLPLKWANLPHPRLNMPCERCGGTRTFRMDGKWGEEIKDGSEHPFGRVAKVVFLCADCGKSVVFLVEFGPVQKTTYQPERIPAAAIAASLSEHDSFPIPPPAPVTVESAAWVRKVGQCPPWFPDVDKELQRALTACGVSNLDSYKKALSCEGESYGMGTFAYYRAIVERILDSLAPAKSAGLSEQDREAFVRQWTDASRDGSARIALVYDTLPEELRVGGANPLDYLYTRLSAGLHGGDDSKCMEQVEELREALLDLIMSLQRERDRKATADRMQERQKKATKGAT